MAKPMKIRELQYPMIQLLIISIDYLCYFLENTFRWSKTLLAELNFVPMLFYTKMPD